ncbi:scoulerine 9-O-methyltransferase [Tripterygium wilfordii]|uniref:Scoulerine 9-O-methyltransferase n=2 Tax=Tripterygium wilfordii TaxID=458696 RepID=A0A7J7CQJ5_TRIWF|nr:scoulerine 9-O-methyltransferase [Tripterygium wilfordii]
MGSPEEDDFLSGFGMTRMIAVQLALRAAVELNVFTIIANSGPEAQLWKKSPEKVYGLTKKSRCLAANDGGVSLASALLFGSEREIVDSFFTLKDAVLEASYKGYNKANGENFFESLEKKPGLNKLFNDYMSVSTKVMLGQVLNVYRGFEEVKELRRNRDFTGDDHLCSSTYSWH